MHTALLIVHALLREKTKRGKRSYTSSIHDDVLIVGFFHDEITIESQHFVTRYVVKDEETSHWSSWVACWQKSSTFVQTRGNDSRVEYRKFHRMRCYQFHLELRLRYLCLVTGSQIFRICVAFEQFLLFSPEKQKYRN